MKRFIFYIAVAALFAGSCAKNEVKVADNGHAITFQTITGLNTKAITGTEFPKDETFSTYAWAEGTVNEYFMQNITVAYNSTDNIWKPQGETFYWPKNTTVDFVSYYPTGFNGITVKEDKITYTDVNVYALQQDIMYADKAVGFSDNASLVDDAINAYTGVPTIFRHATTKVNFLVELTYNHKEEADGTVTDWTVKVNSANINGIYTTGSCELTLADASAVGVVGWNKPTNEIWTADETKTTSITGLKDTELTTGQDYVAIDTVYVLPQALVAGKQKVNVNITVTTNRNGNPFLSETFDVSADLYLADLEYWQMNHIYTYRLRLSPTASNGNGGKPIDPNDPSSGVDPTDPDLSDAIITFDPAVDGWENVGVEAILDL